MDIGWKKWDANNIKMGGWTVKYSDIIAHCICNVDNMMVMGIVWIISILGG